VLGATTLDAYSSAILLPVRLGSGILSALGGVALGLAALGLYAVLSYAVAQRQREIGARMALGATPGRLVAGFLAEAARYAGAGAAAGGVLAFLLMGAVARGAPRVLPSAGGTRVGSFVLALGALAAVAAVAALVPARRATRVSPTVALRAE
jgi:ABC-type antimicrobial peptide transport system permease subunit